MCRNFIWLLVLSAVVMFVSLPASAETILFSDNFDTAIDRYPDINTGINTDGSRFVTGTNSDVTYHVSYRSPTEGWQVQVNPTGGTILGRLQLVGNYPHGDTPSPLASPNHNFNGAESAGGLTIGIDITPPPLDDDYDEYCAIVFGRGSTLNRFGTTDFAIYGNGTLGVHDNGVALASGSWGSTGGTYYHFDVKLTGVGDDNPFDGVGLTKVELFVDGGATPVYSFTSAAPYANNFITLEGETYVNFTGNTSFWDNLTITQIPEPGTLALLTAGLVGLLCYAWRKRK
ncbi:MAG: PEP-CTERM sorting domain-containing protein [Pirellulales bacterium]|nr:PEP-CTERM sorting domain-containing protein [Pirellulales bacterium]